MRRRDFLKTSLMAPLLPLLAGAASPRSVLVVGGTGFIGPHLVKTLVESGHRVTLFNRGKTNTHLFPELEKLKGDCLKDVSALKGRRFDVVFNNIAFVPRAVRMMTEALPDSGFLVLVSTISVYRDLGQKSADEESPLATLEDPTVEEVGNGNYGALKALCEQEALTRMKGRCAVVRPGLIVGPGDKTDRFTYWPARVARGGRMLCPGEPQWGVQFVDVRDLADFMVHLSQKQITGVFNALNDPVPMGELLDVCERASGSKPERVWMDLEAMERYQVRPWVDMPAFIPPHQGLELTVANRRAEQSGYRSRDLADTVRATLEFHLSRGSDYILKAGLKPERETEILAEFAEAREVMKNSSVTGQASAIA